MIKVEFNTVEVNSLLATILNQTNTESEDKLVGSKTIEKIQEAFKEELVEFRIFAKSLTNEEKNDSDLIFPKNFEEAKKELQLSDRECVVLASIFTHVIKLKDLPLKNGQIVPGTNGVTTLTLRKLAVKMGFIELLEKKCGVLKIDPTELQKSKDDSDVDLLGKPGKDSEEDPK